MKEIGINLLSEAKKRGFKSFFDLTEYDSEWVNEATKKDVLEIAEKYNYKVFGISMWNWNIVIGEDLKNIKSFDIDYLFKLEDYEKLKKTIDKFEDLRIKTIPFINEFINTIENLSIFSCIWV